jgi:hypothetical protein
MANVQCCSETATVTEQVAMYLLERHAEIDSQEACYIGAQAEELLAYNGTSSAQSADSEAAAQVRDHEICQIAAACFFVVSVQH